MNISIAQDIQLIPLIMSNDRVENNLTTSLQQHLQKSIISIKQFLIILDLSVKTNNKTPQNLPQMQAPQLRSSSQKNTRYKQQLDTKQKNNNYLLSSKIGDLYHKNQNISNKQLDNPKFKNPTDNAQYIRNLYKKYLVRQNNNNSQRKTKTDVKNIKQNKILITQQNNPKITYNQDPPQHHKLQSILQRPSTNKNNPHFFRKLSNVQQVISSQISKPNKSKPIIINFYNKFIDNQLVQLVGDQQNSLVIALQTINAIRKKNYLKEVNIN